MRTLSTTIKATENPINMEYSVRRSSVSCAMARLLASSLIEPSVRVMSLSALCTTGRRCHYNEQIFYTQASASLYLVLGTTHFLCTTYTSSLYGVWVYGWSSLAGATTTFVTDEINEKFRFSNSITFVPIPTYLLG